MLQIRRVQDGKGVGRIVGRCDKPIVVAVLEDRGIAIADEDLRERFLRAADNLIARRDSQLDD